MKSLPNRIYRSRALDVSDVSRAKGDDGQELLEIEFAFASEEPVPRWFGSEVLDVSSKAMRTDRVGQGVCPVLANHQSDQVVGRVISVRVVSGVARARVRFSRSAAARDVVQDVVDGIRQGVSCGYVIHRAELIETGDDGETFRVTDWELFEITIASMPADSTVGTHRSAPEDQSAVWLEQARARRRGKTMTLSYSQLAAMEDDEFERAVASWPEAKRAAAVEARRVDHLEDVGKTLRVRPDRIRLAIESGDTVADLIGEVRRDRAREGRPLAPLPSDGRDPVFGVDGHDMRGASIQSVLRAHISGRPQDAGKSLELFDHFAKRAGREPRGHGGFFVPHEFLVRAAYPQGFETRAVGKGVDGALGAALVPVAHEAAMFEHALRAKLITGRLGIRLLTGLIGDAAIPLALSDPTATWVAEAAGSGSSEPQFASSTISPHTIRARVDITRRMLLQGVPMVEGLIAEAIVSTIGLTLERAIFAGTGTGAEPEGILATSGIAAPTYTTTTGATEYASFVSAATQVADADADLGSTGFVVTTGVRGRLQGKLLDPGSGRFVWQTGPDEQMGSVAGFRAGVTNALPRNLGGGTNEHAIIFGDWSQIVVGLWSGVDLLPDQTTLGDSGGLVLRAFQDADVLVRRAAAFAAMQVNPAA